MLQIISYSIVEGLSLAVLAIGFGLIYNTLKIFHFAYGALFTLAGYLYYSGFRITGILITIFVSMIIETRIYNKLTQKNASIVVTLVSSLGIYIVIVNTIILLFGNESKIFNNYRSRTLQIGYYNIPSTHIILCIISIILIMFFLFFYYRTTLGSKLIAIGENQSLAKIQGIKVNNYRILAMSIGTFFSCAISILKGMDIGIDPYMGMATLLNAAVVFIISGGSNYIAIIYTAILVGLLRNLTTWYLNTQWTDAIMFGLLITILLVKNRGVWSPQLRLEEL